MKRPILHAFALGALLTAALWAAPFWATKPYTQWTAKEVEKILGDPPWVQSADISFDMSGMPQGGMRGGAGSMGGPSGIGSPGAGMGGPGGGMGGPGGGMGGPGGGMQMPSAYVMWQSAPRVRQAMVRAAQLKESPAAAELEQQLATESTHHILAVMGLSAGPGVGPGMMRRPGGEGGGQQPSPEQMAEMRARMEERMKENTILTIDGTKLTPEKIETVLSGTERILMFYFPKTVNFTAKSKNIVFQTQMGPLKLNTKFKPKDMLE